MNNDKFDELYEQHKAFWARKSGFGPLMGFAPNSRIFPLQNIDIQHEGVFEPNDLTEDIIKSEANLAPAFFPDDSLFPCKIPMEPLEWSQAYLGSKLFVSSKTKTVWTTQYERLPDSVEEMQSQLKPEWREKLVHCTNANLKALQAQLFISESLLRGPADCLEAIIGATEMCLWILDDPKKVATFMDWITERVIELHKAQLNVMPRYHGGTFNRYRIWGAGENIVTQADVSNLMSPYHFRYLFVPAYQKLLKCFDTTTIHFHSCAFQHVDALMEIEELDAIEWGMDPTGPTLEDMIPVFNQILEKKCVILMNIRADEEVKMLLDKLPHEGLCIIKRREY